MTYPKPFQERFFRLLPRQAFVIMNFIANTLYHKIPTNEVTFAMLSVYRKHKEANIEPLIKRGKSLSYVIWGFASAALVELQTFFLANDLRKSMK